MKITHVIRGNDHLPNTPQQVLCYQALGYPLPLFAHMPLILAADKTRLSKRHGATSVLAFRDMGILPEALLNYLARLGWSHGDQEIFSRDDLIRHFDLAHVGAADAVFDLEKFKWVDHQWISACPPSASRRSCGPSSSGPACPPARPRLGRARGGHAEGAGAEPRRDGRAGRVLPAPAHAYDPQATAKFWKEQAAERYAILIKRLKTQEAMNPQALEELYRFSPPISSSSSWTWPSSRASR